MSKRAMDMQGGGERYGFGEETGDNAEKPMKATAAQLAKRNIAPLKRRPATGSARSSRQPSPAVGFAQTQSFQPPPGAQFNFSFGGEGAPSFGAQPQQQQNGTPSFNFSTPQPETQQNGGGMFGSASTTAFGGFGAQTQQSQHQTNGFNPSTSTMFGQSNAAPAGQFNFGQSQPTPQTNGTSGGFGGFGQQNGTSNAPSTSLNFGATGDQSKESTPSFQFGAQPGKSKESTPSLSFGTPAPAEKPKESTPNPFSFGPSKPAQPAMSQQSGFQFGASQPETTQAASTFSFGQSTQSTQPESSTPATGLFGATPPPTQPAASGGESIFRNLNKPNGIKAGMFTQSQQDVDQTPKPKTTFSFTAQTEKKLEDPKPNGLFFTPQPEKKTEPPKSSGFTFGQTSAAPIETPKPANRPFNFGQSSTQPTPPPAAPALKPSVGFSGFGQSQTQAETPKPSNMFAAQSTSSPKLDQEDASMTTPGHTPQKPDATLSAAPEQSSHSNGQSLFDRMTPKEPPATAPKPRLGGPLFATGSSSQETPKASSKNLFERVEAPATAPRPSTSFAGINASAAATKPQPSAPSTAQPLTTKIAPSASQERPLTAEEANRTPLGRDWAKLSKLNHNTLNYLKTRDPDADWSPVFFHYMQEAARLLGKEGFQPSSGASAVAASSSTSTATAKQSNQPSQNAAPSNFSTPKSQAIGNIFSKAADPPATAPVNKKRPAEDDAPQPPATEKRVKSSEAMQYPKLPETASNTARLFESTLSKSAETPKPKSGFNPSTTSMFSSQKTAASSDASAKTSQSTTGFKPTGFQPTGGASTGDFLASFGKQAEDSQKKEQRKRKEQEYDSEEEDEASWEAKDKAQREEQRRKIEEAAKGTSGFVFKPTSTSATGQSLFSFDGAADKTQGEKSQGSGDHTWKPETPIKFGSSIGQSSTTPAAPPPANPFAGLFGASSSTQSTTNPGKLAPPSVGFQFGALKGSSVDTSRATTPGVTTDGETSNAGEGEPSDEQNDPQAEDMTALLPEEITGHQVLFETRMARAVKLESKKVNNEDSDGTPRASMQAAWVEKGRGPLYVLKDKSTGKTRVLLKVPPLGRPALNHPLINVEYKLAQGKDKVVQCTFIDHTGSSEERAGKPSTWTIQVKAASEASKLVEIFNSNRS